MAYLPPDEKQYTLVQLKELLDLYAETRKKFWVDTGATYQPISTPKDHVMAFLNWMEYNQSLNLIK